MSALWFCDRHHAWTNGDCRKCDDELDELIALTEETHTYPKDTP